MPSFHDIVGQHHCINILQSFLKKQAYPQSLLFEGEAGLGKRLAAEVYSQKILCHSDTADTMKACGICLSCQKMQNQNHPDFSVISPDGNAIKIDQIRNLQEKLIYKPIDGDRKIVIIDPADKMNKTAANGLLKTLEEPPPYAMIILISSKTLSLLPTLRSRCQKVSFHPHSFSQIVHILKKEKGWADSDAHLVAAASQGRLQVSLGFDIASAREMDKKYHMLVAENDLFETVPVFSGSLPDFEAALSYLMTWIRDALVLKSLNTKGWFDPTMLRYSWRVEEIKAWTDQRTGPELHRLFDDLQTIYHAQSRNVNRQLSLETFLMRFRKSSPAQARK